MFYHHLLVYMVLLSYATRIGVRDYVSAHP